MSKISARTSDAAMSEPWPPAFIRTAPPIEPGMPTAHSNPVRPAAAVLRARTGRATAEPAHTETPRISMSSASSARLIATPANPASAMRRLEPRPTTNTGRSYRLTTSATAWSCEIDAGDTKMAALPPTRYVVNVPSGSSTRQSEPRSAAARSRRSVDGHVEPTLSSVRRCCSSSGSDAMSPHPIEMHTSPARSSLAR